MSLKKALLVIVFAEVLVIILGLANYGLTIQALQAIARFSGRLSLFIFSLLLLLPMNKKVPVATVLSESYYLVFAIAHGIHLIELLSFITVSGEKLIPIRAAGGFLAYVFIFIMPWLNERNRKGQLSSVQFKRVEAVYLSYLWLIFFLTYLPRVLGKLPRAGGTFAEHVTLIGAVLLIGLLRIVQQLINKKSA